MTSTAKKKDLQLVEPIIKADITPYHATSYLWADTHSSWTKQFQEAKLTLSVLALLNKNLSVLILECCNDNGILGFSNKL